jgi:hypothetical protein
MKILSTDRSKPILRGQAALPFSGTIFFGRQRGLCDKEIDLGKKMVQTTVGEVLFVSGHKDGPLDGARLEHSLGVPAREIIYMLPDAYNHAIRLIGLEKQEASTLVGKRQMKVMCNINDPSCDALWLFEPNNVKIGENMLYSADTNNHLTRIFDPESKVLRTLPAKE